MRYTQETGEILQKKEIAPGIYDITVNLPKIAKAASVGQFVNIYCGGFTCAARFPCAGLTKTRHRKAGV